MKTITVALEKANFFTTTFRSEYFDDVLQAVALISWNKEVGPFGEMNEIHGVETIIDHGAADCMTYQMSVTYFNESGRVAQELAAAEAAAEAEQQGKVSKGLQQADERARVVRDKVAYALTPYLVKLEGHKYGFDSFTAALELIENAGALILSEDREYAKERLSKGEVIEYVIGGGAKASLQDVREVGRKRAR